MPLTHAARAFGIIFEAFGSLCKLVHMHECYIFAEVTLEFCLFACTNHTHRAGLYLFFVGTTESMILTD